MTATKDRILTAKEDSTVTYYLDPKSETYNNWGESYLKAGYSQCTGWKQNADTVKHKDCITTEIERRRALMQAKTETTVETVQKLYQDAYDTAQTYKQPSAMVSAATGIARLHGMDKDSQINDALPDALSAEELAQLKDMARSATALRLAGDGLSASPQATGAPPVHEQGSDVPNRVRG